MTQPTFVVDSRGAKYQLGKRLGEGGQGAVYAVQGGRLAAKVLAAGSKTDPKRLERQLQFLRTLDLAGIPIAQPEAVLAPPHVGYIMRLLTDMDSLKQLMVPPSGTSSLRRWYLDTGGLRRRLKVCGHAATALAMLHAKGLCYGDVSPANIFVSTVTTSDTVYLIDADNVRYESSPNTQPVYTSGYGAPEVVARRGFVSTLTDAHGLAVVAFATLVLVHPLQGDLVEEGDPDLEERALCGLLPWIDHPTDLANRSSRGIRERDVVLSGNLRHLASQAFGDGLSDPRKRPSAREWAEALERASRNCLVCPSCKAKVLEGLKGTEAREGIQANDLIDRMQRASLWTSPGGKTPAATLYAAMIREIKVKKGEARFVRVSPGHFAMKAAGKARRSGAAE